jgi:hypothetical protein
MPDTETLEPTLEGGMVPYIETESHQPVPSQHHILVGLRTLATMPEEEFKRRKEEMRRGLDRMQEVVREILEEDRDYGRVKGIDRPFLFQAGAELLANFYGLAIRHEVDRIVRRADDSPDIPPYEFHCRSYVHLGSFDGPIVAMGYGEANPYEERYRYRWQKPTCPACGREGLIQGRPDGKLAGKWWCPGREGGCNRTFEPNAKDENGEDLIKPRRKVENTDIWGLAETILQMAVKRSLVAAVRRATGTSGLFTQDPDSPSVEAQASEVPTPPEPPVVEVVEQPKEVAKGGRETTATDVQIAEVQRIAKAKGLGPDEVGAVVAKVLNISVDLSAFPSRRQKGIELLKLLSALEADELGQVIAQLEK